MTVTHKLTFEKVVIQNFFSFGDQPTTIMLNKSPTTALIGLSGSGKSSGILDSVFFGLYGEPYRNINIPNIINSINDSNCLVEIYFRTNGKRYMVRRGLKPKIFEIYENDVMLEQDSNTKDYQDRLETHILGGINRKIFKQIVVMGSAEYKPFMQLSAAERREVIEELLDIKIFSNMLEVTKEYAANIKENLITVDAEIKILEEKIKMHQDNANKNEKETSAKTDDLTARIDKEQAIIVKLSDEVKALKAKQSDYNDKLKDCPSLAKNYKELELMSMKLDSSKDDVQDVISFFEKNEVCPTCQQPIEENHKHGIVNTNKTKLEKIQGNIGLIADDMKKKSEMLKLYDDVKTLVNGIERDIVKKETEVSTHKDYIKALKQEIKILSSGTKKDDTEIKSFQDQLDEYKKQKIDFNEERYYYEIVINLLKDGGIKTKIVKQYLPVMNKLINKYLERFGLPVEFTLDEKFNEVIKARYKDKYQYNNFSEGQKHRIDLAILFAWREIAKSKNTLNTNLIIFDEILDKAVPPDVFDEIIEVVQEMGKNHNIFVISHRTDLSDKLRSAIKFEMRGNFSHMVV